MPSVYDVPQYRTNIGPVPVPNQKVPVREEVHPILERIFRIHHQHAGFADDLTMIQFQRFSFKLVVPFLCMIISFTFGFPFNSRTSIRLFRQIARTSTVTSATGGGGGGGGSDVSTIATTDHTTTTSSQLPSLPTIVLKRSHQSRALRDGNPLVFTKALLQSVLLVNGKEHLYRPELLPLANLVHVVVESDDEKASASKKEVTKGVSEGGKRPQPRRRNHQPIGIGVYNPHSLYKIRILCHVHLQPTLYRNVMEQKDSNDDGALLLSILVHHLQMALRKRQSLNLPSYKNANTGASDTYRLVNGEGDNLSGLVVDIVANHVAVVMSSACWCQVHRPIIEHALQTVLPHPDEIVWKTTPSRLEQDGWYTTSVMEDEDDHRQNQMVLSHENGIRFQTYPFAAGQKTGM